MNESIVAKTDGDRNRGWRRRFLFPAILIVVPYLLAEFFFSALYVHGVIYPPQTGWYFEESGRTVHFDPIRGYSLTTVPSRFARVTYGLVELTGTLRGNAQGFPDRDDFSPGRDGSRRLRVAVFGDSFSAAQFLDRNWPDAVEDLLNVDRDPKRVELLNFSVDGGGLANWWSVLRNILDKENYEIDAVLFAPYRHNLGRTFSIAEHRGYSRHMFGRTRSWNADDWPKTQSEARKFLQPLDGYILSKDDYQKALEGEINPALPRPWRPYFAGSVWRMFTRLIGKTEIDGVSPRAKKFVYNGRFDAEQEALIEDIADFSRSREIPVIVVRVPAMDELILRPGTPRDVLHFSRLLGAEFVDGGLAYSGWTEEQIRSGFFPFDRHWNQTGSDAFAAFMAGVLEQRFANEWSALENVSAVVSR